MPLLTRLHALTRADCTTRNARKAARLAATYDALEARIEVLREQEELDKIRPELDGEEIMRILGLKPGPLVGKAWNFLLELRLSEGMLGRERATAGTACVGRSGRGLRLPLLPLMVSAAYSAARRDVARADDEDHQVGLARLGRNGMAIAGPMT